MLIDCPGCGKSYHITKSVLGLAGRRAVCPSCDAVWFVAGDDATTGADQTLGAPAEISITVADRNAHRAEPSRPGRPSAVFPACRFSFAPALPSAPERRLPRPLKDICAGLALVALTMAAIGLRTEIVRLWPRAATAYAALGLAVNPRGLALENFHTVATNDGFQTVLGIEGKIVNLRSQATKIPPIQIAIRDGNSRVLYSWHVAAPKQSLAANETLTFRARLAAPPAAGQTVLVRFTPLISLASARQKTATHF